MLGPIVALSLLAAPAPVPAPAAQLHPFSVDDMLAMQRIADPVLSPDGKRVAFALRTTDLAADRGRWDVWVVGVDGKDLRRLTSHPDSDTAPQWMPDGKAILFLSTRSGSAQVWRLDLAGGDAQQVTNLPIDVGTFKPSPDGGRLLLSLDVYVAAKTLAETAARDEAKANDKVQVLAYDELLFRHWDAWEDGKRSHVFAWDIARGGEPVDLMRGMDADSPEHPFGDTEEYDISPDGKTVAFVARNAARDAAWSTNLDVWLVPADGSRAPLALTAENLGADAQPAFSPDGKTLAVISQARAGYESDKGRVVLWDVATRKSRVLTDAWDRSAGELAWSRDGKSIFTSSDHIGNHAIFRIDAKTGAATLMIEKGTNSGVLVGKDAIVYQHDSLTGPIELWTASLAGKDAHAVTAINAERVAAIDWPSYEQFTFKGAHGDEVHGFAVKPAGLKDGERRPTVMIIHGGPQGSMGDHFHYRWNPMAFAGHGFAVVFIDFHGSTGYGQAFTDAIRGDWGGAPFEDLMAGMDAALARYPYMDASRTAAAGASYGGYMINWINGNTDRFKALVVHDGNIDERMAYFDTEELWFPEWEHGGLPWDKASGYGLHNPIDHVDAWKTPTLVIHGGNDFRVVATQGMATFTALQRKGVPSRFVYFPNESHWVLKPGESRRWHQEVLGWLDKWLSQ